MTPLTSEIQVMIFFVNCNGMESKSSTRSHGNRHLESEIHWRGWQS